MNLKESKDKLAAALGDDMKTYLEYLKLWFRQKVTRDEFESRTRRLLKHQHLLRLHNEFILDLLAECQSFAIAKPLTASWSHSVASTSASTSSFSQQKRRKISNESAVSFKSEPTMAESLSRVEFDNGTSASVSRPNVFPNYCSNDLLLPDVSLVAGRAKITAWLQGLSEGVSDDASEMVVHACDAFLKRFITAAIMSGGTSIHRRLGSSGHRAAPFGRPVLLKPNSPWPEKIFDAIYPELNHKNYSTENSRSLLSAVSYREIVEAQEAHLMAFDNAPDQKDELTLDRIKQTLQLSYVDLHLPKNFHSRCLIRVNGAVISK